MRRPTETHGQTPEELAGSAPRPDAGGSGPGEIPGGYLPDDWENQPQGRRGPREHLRRYRLGTAFVIVFVTVMFLGATSAYLIRKESGRLDPYTGVWARDWIALQLPSILWLNTVLLVLSSLTMEAARRQLFRETAVMKEWLGIGAPTRAHSAPWLAITFILGLAFLAGQFIAWQQLLARNVYLSSNPSASFFYLFTATHALHLLVGIGAIAWALAASFRSTPLLSRQVLVDSTSWFWHAMAVLWIYILVVLRVSP